MGKRELSVGVMLVILTFLSACWDEKNIEERGFIVGEAIDLADKQTKGNTHLALTYQFVVPSGIMMSTDTESEDEEPFSNVTVTGDSMQMITKELETRISRPPFFDHLKVLVVSEQVAKEADLFSSVMDILIRDQQIRRGVSVMIADGKAKNVIDVQPSLEDLPAMFIDSVLKNSSEDLDINRTVDVGAVHGYLLDRDSYALPRVKPVGEKQIGVKGAAVFNGKKNQLVGMLDAQETKGLNLATQKHYGGMIEFKINDRLMVFKVDTTQNAMTVNHQDPDNMKVGLDITVEGSIAEMFGSESLLSETYLKKIEKRIEARIEQLVNRTIDKLQNDLNADVLGINKVLRQKHYDLWNKVKDDWEQGKHYFSKVNVDTSAHVTIKGIGTSDRAKTRGD